MPNKKVIDEIFICDCESHILRLVEWFDLQDTISLMYYTTPNSNLTLWQRIKLALGYIFKPDKYDIHGDFILSKNDAKRLGEKLLKYSNKKEYKNG